MSFTLLIHSYGGANETVARHWPYFLRAGASRIVGVDTIKRDCVFPDGIQTIIAGDGRYMNGDNLPRRLLDTIAWCAWQPEDRFVIAEYDTLFFHPIHDFIGVCCDRTGGQTWGSKASWFGHNPWCFDRESCQPLMNAMVEIISEGHCSYGKPESSPDVFFAYACERAGISVRHDLFRLFTRNCFDIPGDLELARAAYCDGVDCIHGIKTADQLSFVLT